MEDIKSLPPMERPREKLELKGPALLSDLEILAILIGSGNKKLSLSVICENLLRKNRLQDIAAMDMGTLCEFPGIGPARATTLLAAIEFSRRLESTGQSFRNEQEIYQYVRPLLKQAEVLQYILLLISEGKELLAFAEAGNVLPDITWVTRLATEAGAHYILLARNGWPGFSNAEGRYLQQLGAAAAMLGLTSGGLMAVGPTRFKIIGSWKE